MDMVQGIRVFVATVESGSFSGAALRLGISAKLASKYMGELEARLGAQLLHRTTRRLGLTAAGEQMMARAPDWLDLLEEMTGDLREGRGLSGVLRVSAPVTFGEMHVQPMLCRFREPHPALQVDLRLSDRFVDLAAEGIDLAIRIGRLDSSALITRRLGQTRLLLVASPAYLGNAGEPGRLDDLPRHLCIRDTNLRDGAWPLTEGGEVRRVVVAGRYMVNSARTARDLALAGEGIALCPDYIVRGDLEGGQLIQVLCETSGPVLDIHAVHLGGRRLARRTRALMDYLVADRFGGFLDQG